MKITKKMMIKFRAFSLAGTARLPRRHGTSATPAWQMMKCLLKTGKCLLKMGKLLAVMTLTH